jgi:arginase
MYAQHVQLLGIAAGRGAGRAGAEDGPRRLRELGIVGRLSQYGHRVEDLGDIPGIQSGVAGRAAVAVNSLHAVMRVNQHTHDCVLGMRRQSPLSFPLIVGGDHSLAVGTLAGLADACERLGILWIDAHGDFNTPRLSPSGNAHGMSLALACGHGYLEFRQIGGRDPVVDEGDVFVLGVRDLDAGERSFLETTRVQLFEMPAWRDAGLVEQVVTAAQTLAARCDHVHLSFDIDVLDAPLVPGTGTPVAGGLSLAEAQAVLNALSNLNVLASAEFVEYNPHLDETGTTGPRALELISTLLSTSPRAVAQTPSRGAR